VNVESVLPRDAIPSIDDPEFGRGYIGGPEDEVIVVDGDPPRAYPIRILSYHEIVNDVLESTALEGQPEPRGDSGEVVDGRPIAVTWCPICWSAVVYDRTVEGRTLTFGTSGKLADDALVMYDRETGSEWKQPTGTAIAGQLEGSHLETLPSPIVTWDRFTEDHPDGVVLQPVRRTADGTGPSPQEIYQMGPYDSYVAGDEFGLYGMRGEGERRSWDRDDLAAKTVVLGIEWNGESRGYPVQRVEAEGGVVEDTIGGLDVVVFVSDQRIHAFERAGLDFEWRSGSIQSDGASWDPVTGESDDGRRLQRVPGRRMFAFAWQDAHGADAFYSGRGE